MNETRERIVLGCDASPCNYCDGTLIHLNWLFKSVYSQFLSTNSVLRVSKLEMLLSQPTNLNLDSHRNHDCKELASKLITNMLRLRP